MTGAPDEGPAISVIVPALDEAAEIAQTIGCIGRHHEIIVVDGGSTDGTASLASATGARVMHSQPGRALQMNRGAAAARGRILLFLHADTRLPAGWDAAVVRAISSGAVAGRFDLALRGEHPFLPVVATLINLRSRWTRIYTGDQAIFVRRSVFERIGGYEPIGLMEDLAMSRRLKREGAIACLHEKVSTSARRWETRGVFRTIGLMWLLRGAYFLGVSPERLRRLYR